MSAAPPPAGYMSRRAAAQAIGWWPQRLGDAIARGDINAYELNGRILLREDEVEAFAAKIAEPRPWNPDSL